MCSNNFKGFFNHPEVMVSAREITQQTMASVSLDHPSPRLNRKLPHPFQNAKKKSHSTASSSTSSSQHHQQHGNIIGSNTPPDSPTLPGRKLR